MAKNKSQIKAWFKLSNKTILFGTGFEPRILLYAGPQKRKPVNVKMW